MLMLMHHGAHVAHLVVPMLKVVLVEHPHSMMSSYMSHIAVGNVMTPATSSTMAILVMVVVAMTLIMSLTSMRPLTLVVTFLTSGSV